MPALFFFIVVIISEIGIKILVHKFGL
jgi:hypothetical protein